MEFVVDYSNCNIIFIIFSTACIFWGGLNKKLQQLRVRLFGNQETNSVKKEQIFCSRLEPTNCFKGTPTLKIKMCISFFRFVSANLQVNKFKNRLVNILPFESSRVCLTPLRGKQPLQLASACSVLFCFLSAEY